MPVAPIPEREFDLYALGLPRGPNFEPYVVVSGWKCDNSRSVGGVLLNHDTEDFGIHVFRRRTDHCFVTVTSKFGFSSEEAALVELKAAMRPGESGEQVPPGTKKRRPLLPATAKKISETFTLLTSTLTRYPVLMAASDLLMPAQECLRISDRWWVCSRALGFPALSGHREATCLTRSAVGISAGWRNS
jgi:hypothetical protein